MLSGSDDAAAREMGQDFPGSKSDVRFDLRLDWIGLDPIRLGNRAVEEYSKHLVLSI